MFNRNQHLHRLARANKAENSGQDFLLRHTALDMMDRLSLVQRKFETGIALFGRNELLFDVMGRSDQIANVLRVEDKYPLNEDCKDTLRATPDLIDLPDNSADLIMSPMTLHWSSDLPGTLIQLRKILRPDGLLLATLPGPDTLWELRGALLKAESEISGGAANRVDPFTDIRDAGSLLQRAGFALPVVDQELLTVRYDTALDLIRDLRLFGATSHLEDSPRPPLNREIISKMIEFYAHENADEDGRIRSTFSIISMSAWVPHDSQQKPLKPGSAQSRLSDALKTQEHKI